MHNTMVRKVLRSFVLFFDSNPVGRILTRFSKDMIVIDLIMIPIIIILTQGIFRALSVGITVAVFNPYLLIVIAIALVLMILVLRIGAPAMIEA